MRRLVVLLALALAGCQSADTLALADWTLDGTPVRLPAHLESRLPPEATRYTLRTTLTVPPELSGRTITLAIPYLPSVIALRANGEPVAPLDASPPGDYRGGGGGHRWHLRPALTNGPLTLELTVQRRWTRSTWFDTLPRLSGALDGDANFRWVRAINGDVTVGALAMLLLVTFTHLLIYLLDRRRSAHGWLALQVGSSAVYPLYVLGATQILGTADSAVMLLLLTVSLVAGIQFAGTEFNLPSARRAWGLSVAGVALATLLVHGPYNTLPLLLPPFAILIVGSIGHMAWIYVRASRRPEDRTNALTFLAAWALIFFLSQTDVIGLLGRGQLLGGAHLAPLSFGLFHVLQSIALGRKHIESLARADRLNVELAGRIELLEQRHREIQQLNEELRRQIGERSRQLAQTLASLNASSGSPMPLLPGDTVEERYRVVRALGQGGMGAVYEVERITDGRKLALKQLRGPVTVTAIARLAREAQIISSLHDPRLVSIVDMNVAATGTIYLVMELVDGSSLEAQRARFGELGWGLAVLAQVAAGLEVIHAHGVVHRDLKPANILLAGGDRALPQVKIADFGIARVGPFAPREETDEARAPQPVSDEGWTETVPPADGTRKAITGAEDTVDARAMTPAPLTEVGVVVGTPMYVAPELCDGVSEATPASDLFSLGVIAYELLCGVRPYLAPLVFERMQGRTPPRPRSFKRLGALDASVAELLDRCLDEDPARRPTAREVAAALQPSAVRVGAG